MVIVPADSQEHFQSRIPLHRVKGAYKTLGIETNVVFTGRINGILTIASIPFSTQFPSAMVDDLNHLDIAFCISKSRGPFPQDKSYIH